MVMELVSGPSLRRCLDDGPLGPEPTALLGAELAAALAHVHARGIVHRDVKPANILLTAAPGDGSRASVKLADFGIARTLESARLTTDGSTIGTANYLSPEQVASGDVTGASDVYSLALVLLECLTGRLAYPGVGVQAAVARLESQPVVPTQFGGRWARLLTAMTSREPDERPTAAEVAIELTALSDGRASVGADRPDVWALATQAHAAVVADAPVRRRFPVAPLPRRWWVAGLGLLAAAVCASLVLLAVRPAASHAEAATPPYPAVPGQLGADLRHLEGVTSRTPAQLPADLRVLASAAAAHQYAAAISALGDLRADLAAAGVDGTVRPARMAQIRAAMVAVQQDLMAATVEVTPTAAASAAAGSGPGGTSTGAPAAGSPGSATGPGTTHAAPTPVTVVKAAKPAKPGKAKKHPPKPGHHH